MKKILSLRTMGIALMFIVSMFAAAETKAQDLRNEILKRMDEHQKALTSLQANVMMDKFNAQLNEHDISEGTTMYLPAKGRDALVRIDWVKPVQETLSVVNKQFVIYRPRLKQAIVGKVDSKSKEANRAGALSFMSMSKDQLKANYDVQYLGKENVSTGPETWHLKLVPKTPTNYQYAEVWVDGNGMPLQAKIVENNNDSTTVLLSNLQKNVTLDAKKFKIQLPKDTQIIKG
jgi:outer membrane lipoprotein-sorting protein